MSFLDIIIDPVQALLPTALGNILDPLSLHNVEGLLLPKPPAQGVQPGGAQVYQIANQQNLAQIDNPQTVIGGTVRRWPELKAQPWNEYIANDQVLHQTMRLGVGINMPLDMKIGDADASSSPGLAVQVCWPKVPMTLFHPNVYTNPDATGIDIATGALKTNTFTGTFIFGGSGHVGRIDHDGGDNVFHGNVPVGSIVTVAGTSGVYDGSYVTTSINGAAELVDTTATFTSGTVTATVTWLTFDANQNNVKQSTNVNLVFNNTFSTITCAPNDTYPNDLSAFAIGDTISAVSNPAGANQNIIFSILGADDTGAWIVSPAPTTLSGIISDVVLLRRYHGPYIACPQGATINQVGIDIVFPQGLVYNGTDGNAYPASVTFDVQWQPIDDLGIPQVDWVSFGLLTITDSKRTPQRRTFNYSLSVAQRVQVRLARVSGDSNDSLRQDAAQWTGLKGFIVPLAGEDPTVDVDSTVLALTVHASGTLAPGSDKKINCLVQAWKQIYDPGTLTWSAEQPTNNPVWMAMDALRGPYTAKGVPIPDSQIDLVGFAALAANFDAEDIEFNGAFESETTLLDALQTILRVGRAAPTFDWVNNFYSYRRDVQSAPVQMFTDLNCSVSNMRLTLRGENAPTGVQVSYQDPLAWEERTTTIGDVDTKPQKTDLRNGCTDRQTDWLETNYEWNELLFRNRSCTLNCEMEPISIKFGAPLLVQSRTRKWGQGAEVAAYAGRTLTVMPPLDWTDAGSHFVYLRGPDGAPGAKIGCTRGAGDNIVVLDSDPDVAFTGDSTGEDRTHLAFGVSGNEPVVVLAMGISWSLGDNGGQQATIQGVLDDSQMYADPGPAPADPYAVSGVVPNLAITGLAVANASGVETATWNPVDNAVFGVNAGGDIFGINAGGDQFLIRAPYAGQFLYEVQWQYNNAFFWTTVARTTQTTAKFSVPHAGVINTRVRVLAQGGQVSDYTVVQTTIAAGTGGAGALTASASPASLFKSTSAVVGITSACSVTVSGGAPPYTGVWTKVSGDDITAVSPTSATTTFRAAALLHGESRTAIFKNTPTDSAGTSVDSNTVSVTIENTYSGGGGAAP